MFAIRTVGTKLLSIRKFSHTHGSSKLDSAILNKFSTCKSNEQTNEQILESLQSINFGINTLIFLSSSMIVIESFTPLHI
jgi:hypothetical protein